ncbi:MAG: hypothetical protein ICV79_05430, partial [Flavisolibacter sp.]|nr:hypothetical protein [Flavisolibacter sp.]
MPFILRPMQSTDIDQKMKYDKAYAYLMPKLERELPTYLTYHNAQHTKNVIQTVEQIAKAEKVSGHD